MNESSDTLTNVIPRKLPHNYSHMALYGAVDGLDSAHDVIVERNAGKDYGPGQPFDLEFSGQYLMKPDEAFLCFPITIPTSTAVNAADRVVPTLADVADLFDSIKVTIGKTVVFQMDEVSKWLKLKHKQDGTMLGYEELYNPTSGTGALIDTTNWLDAGFKQRSIIRERLMRLQLGQLKTGGSANNNIIHPTYHDNGAQGVLMLPLTYLGFSGANLYPLFMDSQIRITIKLNSIDNAFVHSPFKSGAYTTNNTAATTWTTGSTFRIAQPYTAMSALPVSREFAHHVVGEVVDASASALAGQVYKFQHVYNYPNSLKTALTTSFTSHFFNYSHGQTRVDYIILFWGQDSGNRLWPFSNPLDGVITEDVLQNTPATRLNHGLFALSDKPFIHTTDVKIKVGGQTMPIDERYLNSVALQFQRAKHLFPLLTLDQFLTDNYILVFPLMSDTHLNYNANLSSHEVTSGNIQIELKAKITDVHESSTYNSLADVRFNCMIMSNNLLYHRGYANEFLVR